MKANEPWWKWPLFWAGFAVLYAVTGNLCILASAMVANVSWILYVPAGLSLTASLLWGSRVWPGVFLGEFVVALTGHLPIGSALVMAGGNALDAGLAGWWFRDRPGRRIEFDRLGDTMQLLVGELIFLQPLSTAMGMAALVTAGQLHYDRLWSTASAWYASNIFAEFVCAPTVVAWMRWPRAAHSRREFRELIALFLLTLLVGALGPGRWATHNWPLPVTLFFAFPLLVWASVRFVPSVAVSVGAILGLFAFDAVLEKLGPFQGAAPADRMVYLNVFMGVCLGTGVFLASAMAQRRRDEAEQERLISELSASAKQVRRLEEFVTFCAWSGRVRWKERWVSVESFLHERYNVNISHGISEDALDALLKELPPCSEPPANPPA